jgi:membrane protein
MSGHVARRIREGAGWVARLAGHLDRHHVLEATSAIAFDAFLSLIPILAAAGYLLHHVYREGGGDLLAPLLAAAPPPIRELAGAEFLRLSAADAATIAPLSGVAFLWVSSAGLSTAMAVFERMFAAPPRPFVVRRSLATAGVIGGVAVLGVAAALPVLAAAIASPALAAIVAFVVPTALVLAGLVLFHRVAIRRPNGVRRRTLPGAVVTLVLWIALSIGFSAYVARLASYGTLYGGLATAAILLLWLWLLSLSLLVGGEVNAMLEGVRDGLPRIR